MNIMKRLLVLDFRLFNLRLGLDVNGDLSEGSNMGTDKEGQVLVLVDPQLGRERGDLGNTTKDVKIEDLRYSISRILGILVSKGYAPGEDRVGDGAEADLTLFGEDVDGIADIGHVLDHLLELSRVDDNGAVVAFGEFDVEGLDALDLDVGNGNAGLLLGDDFDAELALAVGFDEDGDGVLLLGGLEHAVEVGIVEADGDGVHLVLHTEDGEGVRVELENDENLLVGVGDLAEEAFGADFDGTSLDVILK